MASRDLVHLDCLLGREQPSYRYVSMALLLVPPDLLTVAGGSRQSDSGCTDRISGQMISFRGVPILNPGAPK
jgi:hypothetical protein